MQPHAACSLQLGSAGDDRRHLRFIQIDDGRGSDGAVVARLNAVVDQRVLQRVRARVRPIVHVGLQAWFRS